MNVFWIETNTMVLSKDIHKLRSFHMLRLIKRTYATRQELYSQCYSLLGVDESSDQNVVRNAYIALVKKLHPDSGHPEANADKFQQVDRAFKILQSKYAKQRRGILEDMQSEVKIFDIKHTAPQHRQFLSYDGIGTGTLSQRERQYQQWKVIKAQERVLEHRLQKAQASEGSLIKKGEYFKKHEIKTKYGFDRVVEDYIQEAMSRGDFENLKGVGKPLPDIQSQNPYVDFTTHKLNKILFDNGFVPEWINLQKEIREEIKELKCSLEVERKHLGPLPLSPLDQGKWNETIQKHEKLAININKKIDKFNLIVPMMDKQMIHVQLSKICDKILHDTKPYDNMAVAEQQLPRNLDAKSSQSGLMTLLSSFFVSN